MEKDLKRIVKPVMDSQPNAPSAIIADIVLIEHRSMLHAWLASRIDAERKRETERPSPWSDGRSRRHRPDPRQEWLDLPEFQHIRAEVQGDTLEEFQERIAALERKIRTYSYARVAAQKEKEDKRELREMKLLKTKLWRFFQDNPTLTIGRALEMYMERRKR